jgi:hypothetical protein
VLVSILKTSRSHDLFPGALSPSAFSGPSGRRSPSTSPGSRNPGLGLGRELRGPAPRRALAVIECTPWAAYDGGDHTLVVGEVVDFAYRDGEALGYFCGRFVRLEMPSLGIEVLF